MRLIKTTFNNFRCFTNYHLKYGSETTVFIGKNGTGKSSILSGIRRGLSFMFAKPKGFSKNLSTSNNAQVRGYEIEDANFDSLHRTYNYPIENKFTALFNSETLAWAMVKNAEKGGYSTNSYKEALQIVLSFYNNNLLAPLPVLAVITDSFPHEKINFGSKVKKTVGQDILPRDLAYYGWDERTNCIELWLNRFYKISNFEKDLSDDIRSVESQIEVYRERFKDAEENDDSKLNHIHGTIAELNERLQYLKGDKRSQSFREERLFIEEKIFEFTKPLSEEYNFINKELELFRVSVNRPDKNNYTLEFSFKDGRNITFDMLPMGYKRMFSIVIDIAYRSYILNETKESEGVVLIDEIELHLHPTLQQEILPRLRKAFPKIQFIITTHSLLVISNFKADQNNTLIKLEHDGNNYFNEPVENIYGIDYSTNLSEVMEAAPRSSTIDKYISAYLFLTGKGKTNEANEMYEKLKAYVGGTIPELMKNEIDEKKKAYNK